MRLKASEFVINNHLHAKGSKLQTNDVKIFFYFSSVFKVQLMFTKIHFHSPPADAAGHIDEILISMDT